MTEVIRRVVSRRQWTGFTPSGGAVSSRSTHCITTGVRLLSRLSLGGFRQNSPNRMASVAARAARPGPAGIVRTAVPSPHSPRQGHPLICPANLPGQSAAICQGAVMRCPHQYIDMGPSTWAGRRANRSKISASRSATIITHAAPVMSPARSPASSVACSQRIDWRKASGRSNRLALPPALRARNCASTAPSTAPLCASPRSSHAGDCRRRCCHPPA